MPRMNRKSLILFALMGLAAIVLVADFAPREVRLEYRDGLRFRSKAIFFQPDSFSHFSLALKQFSSVLKNRGLTLYFNGTPYPLQTATTATLASLGFAVRRNYYRSAVSNCRAEYRSPESGYSCNLGFISSGRRVYEIEVHCASDLKEDCPFGISQAGWPELRFPIPRADLERVFGPPDSVTVSRTHPLLGPIRSTIRRNIWNPLQDWFFDFYRFRLLRWAAILAW